MLKFLQNHEADEKSKSPKQYRPSMAYGISIQAPKEFQTPHTIIHKESFVNPYLDLDPAREKFLEKEQKIQVKPDWIKKVNLQLIEQRKVVSIYNETQQDRNYKEEFQHEIKNGKKRFFKNKGQFTSILERNHHYKVMGPLQGNQRSKERSQKTKVSLQSSRISKISQKIQTQPNECSAILENLQKKYYSDMANIKRKSKILREKSQIRKNRNSIFSMFKENLQKRKKSSLHKFQLPRILTNPGLASSKLKRSPLGLHQSLEQNNDENKNLLSELENNKQEIV